MLMLQCTTNYSMPNHMLSFSNLNGGFVTPADVLLLAPLAGGTGVPHRRSQSEVPGYQDDEAHCDPFTDISDTLPQKYATLPRNRNPFEGEHGQLWDRAERKEKKEKVSLLERVTGKKDGRKTSNGGRSGSSGDLRAPNPFSGDLQADTNPFSSNYKTRLLLFSYLCLAHQTDAVHDFSRPSIFWIFPTVFCCLPVCD